MPGLVIVWPHLGEAEDRGMRYRVEYPVDGDPDSHAVLIALERVLPEQIGNPRARHGVIEEQLVLFRPDVERLISALGRVLQLVPPWDTGSPSALAVALDTTITPLSCPSCNATCFAPADSHGERLDCTECDARLVTQRDLGGEVSARLLDGLSPDERALILAVLHSGDRSRR